MKKISILFLLAFFLMNTIGLNVYAHFCGSELVKTSIVEKQVSCCGEKQAPSKKGNCCKDQKVQIKIDEDYTTSKSFELTSPEGTYISPFLVSFYFIFDGIQNELTIHKFKIDNEHLLKPKPIDLLAVLRI